MEGLIDQKGREKYFLAMLVVLYFALMAVQAFLPAIAPVRSFPQEFQISYFRIQSVVVFGIVIGMIQLLLSVQFVITARKTGYLLCIGANSFNMLFVLQAIVLKKEFSSVPGIVISLAALIVCTVVYNQYKRIQAHLDSLHRYAYIDDLTGLPNRKERIATISDFISGPNRINAFSLLMVDFDNFKMVNDTIGHQIGDLMLQEIVHNLKNFIKEPASIGRLGGDEFLIILPEAMSETEIENYAAQVGQIINQPFYFKDKDYRLTASFGIARYPKDSSNPSELMQQVDIALFRAKAHGKNQIEFFDEKMQITIETQANIERKLSTAVENHELYIEFQPQYRAPGEELRGFEVLTRWTSPTMGRIAPTDFIPVAEENGLIITIGKWILKEACTGYQQLFGDYEKSPMLAVNISVVQFRDPEFLTYVRQVISETGINTHNLEFEITESVCIQSPETARYIISELKGMGITIALDDFGTGYSSLSYLRTLPLDVVKIDKSFVDTIGKVPDEKNLIKSIIHMAHQLDLEVVAEGIENQQQLTYLTERGCDIIQGNFLGKPAPMAAL